MTTESLRVQTLQNDYFALDILPDLGASVLNLRAASGRPVLRHVQPESVKTSSQCASFTLLPYSNRVAGAQFVFEGKTVQLVPNTAGNVAQHGDVRNRPWQVERAADGHLVCTFDSRHFVDINWPWAFTAQVEYRLHGPHFDTSVTLTNADTTPMPAGMGLHPYFARFEGSTDPTLCFEAGGVYVTDESFIPTQGPQPIPPGLDFKLARPVGDAQFNHVFSSWDGVARLSWNTPGRPERALVLTADALFSHLVLFTAPDGSLAIEPVSHATDAFNLAARGIHGTDMRVLEPGQSLGGAVRVTLEGDWTAGDWTPGDWTAPDLKGSEG